MNRKSSWQRLVAQRLLHFGVALLPRERGAWGEAMNNEMQHMQDDREALAWALSGLRGCLALRLKAVLAKRLFSAHSLGILWIGIFIVSSAYNVGMALSARLGLQRAASVLGWWMREFQYDRYASFAAALPIGLLVLMGIVLLLFGFSLHLSIRNRPSGFAMFSCAVLLSLVAWLCQLTIPAYLEAISSQHRWRIGICFVMTVAVLSALRLPSRNSSSPRLHGRPS
jgi:hypothetical protein